MVVIEQSNILGASGRVMLVVQRMNGLFRIHGVKKDIYPEGTHFAVRLLLLSLLRM